MREISLTQISKPRQEESLKDICASLEKSLVAALKQISTKVNVEPAQNNIQVTTNNDQAYLIEVNRDGHGRISTMVVRPYEPS